MSALKEAFELIEGFPKHHNAPRITRGVEVEHTFTDEGFHMAMRILGKLKQTKFAHRELYGYWQWMPQTENRQFVVIVTKQKIKRDSDG